MGMLCGFICMGTESFTLDLAHKPETRSATPSYPENHVPSHSAEKCHVTEDRHYSMVSCSVLYASNAYKATVAWDLDLGEYVP